MNIGINFEYHINKILYRDTNEEFNDTEPTPWEVHSDLVDFEKKLQNLGSLLNEIKKDIPDSIIIEFNVIDGIMKEGVESFHAALDNQSELVKWATFTQSTYQNLTTLNSSPLRVNSFINKVLYSISDSDLYLV